LGVDRATARVVAHALVVDVIAEAIERPRETDHARAVKPEQLVGEGGNTPESGRFVVINDVAGLPFFREEVIDRRLRLEREQVVDGRGTEEDGLAFALRTTAHERLDAGSREPELQAPLDAARTRTCSARKEQRMVPVLDENARVRLQHVLVE